MAATLPNPNSCCDPCDAPVTVAVPGAAGAAGADGVDGADGINAVTTVTADFAMPGDLANVIVSVLDTTWLAIGQVVWVARSDGSVKGYMQVVTVNSAVSVTLKNLRDAATSAYLSNSNSGTINIGSKVCAGGLQGPAGALTGAAGGHLKGTFPNPLFDMPNLKGGLMVGDGTEPVQVSAGTDGQLPVYDASVAHGLTPKSLFPNTGAADVADNRLLRLDGATGLPVAHQSSRVSVTDTGAIRADGSAVGVLGNARGADAVDLQVTRTSATQVAGGLRSFIGAGAQNTATGIESVVCGGENNVAGAGDRSAVVSGQNNIASGAEAFIGGGQENDATNAHAGICAGDGNTASAQGTFVGSGAQNTASGTYAVVGAGLANIASGLSAGVLSGESNTASGIYSVAVGGIYGLATKYGQQAHASGRFAAQGDAQVSEVILRRFTTDATPAELFLDGAALRLSVPANTSWLFEMMSVARTSAGLDAIYKSEGVIRNNAGATSISGVTTTEIYDGASLPVAPVVVDADDANDALRITVTGIAATNIRWVARVRLVEVGY